MSYKKIVINGTEYVNFKNVKMSKIINQIHSFEFTLYNVDTSLYNTDLVYDNLVVIYEVTDVTEIEIFRGYIRNLNKISGSNCYIFCYNAAVKFYDKTWSERKEYINIATNTILTEVASGIMGIGTNAITDKITTRFELDNKLRSVAQLANIHAAEWWIDTDATLNDRVNIDYTRYALTSVYTVNIGSGFLISEDNTDYDKVYNCITVLGRGDGINQVKSQSYGFCFYTPYLTADITDTDTSLTISDATGFAASDGIIYINNEKIYYATLTGTTLSGLTRGYDSTTANYHSENMRVWYAGEVGNEYTKDSPAPDSSVDVYGVKEYTYSDKTIIARVDGDKFEAAGSVAYLLFNKFAAPIRTVTIRKRRINLDYSSTEVFDVGKTIAIVDSRTGLNGNFKINQISVSEADKEFILITNNLPYNFSTQLDEIEKNMDTLNTYEQGATNIYSVNLSENCDATHPLNMRFYIPEEAVAINRVKVNFKLKNYRAYNQSNSNESSHTHGIPALTVLNHSHSIPSLTVNGTTTSSVTSDGRTPTASGFVPSFSSNTVYYSLVGGQWASLYMYRLVTGTDVSYATILFQCYTANYTGSSQTIQLVVKLLDGTNYPDSTRTLGNGYIQTFSAPVISTTQYGWAYFVNYNVNTTMWWGSASYYYTHNHGSHNHNIPSTSVNSTTTVANTSGSSGSTVSATTTQAGSAHTHGIDWGIYEISLASPSVNISAGIEGSETSVGTYTTDQTNVDITEIVEDIGSDNWINIKFTPNQTMRIEAVAYIQIYIESK